MRHVVAPFQRSAALVDHRPRIPEVLMSYGVGSFHFLLVVAVPENAQRHLNTCFLKKCSQIDFDGFDVSPDIPNWVVVKSCFPR